MPRVSRIVAYKNPPPLRRQDGVSAPVWIGSRIQAVGAPQPELVLPCHGVRIPREPQRTVRGEVRPPSDLVWVEISRGPSLRWCSGPPFAAIEISRKRLHRHANEDSRVLPRECDLEGASYGRE